MDLPASRDAVFASSPLTDNGQAEVLQALRRMELAGATGRDVLRHAVAGPLRDRVAVVSSFGAESALLLSVVAEIDRTLPVVFLETGKHFPQTLSYRRQLTAHLGLTDVREITPRGAAVAEQDPEGELWFYDQDACCRLRKVGPLERALAPFDGWISGRKRFQAATRAALPLVERQGRRLKLNPLADWDAEQVSRELARRDLPRHPLVEQGYPSIGCAVCTRPVIPGEDGRAGRWSGSRKVECGIHVPAT